MNTNEQEAIRRIDLISRRQRAARKVVSIDFEEQARICLNYPDVRESFGWSYKNIFNMSFRAEILNDPDISNEAKKDIKNGSFLRNLRYTRHKLKQACSESKFYNWIWIRRGLYQSYDTTTKARLARYCSIMNSRGNSYKRRARDTMIERIASDLKRSGLSTQEIERVVAALATHDFFAG